MKKALLSCLAILPLLAYCNEIDKLQTNADVVNFLIRKVDKKFKRTTTLNDDTSNMDSSFGPNTFYKLDFDKNGLTDLIVDGAIRILILDMGKNNYIGQYIDRGTFLAGEVKIISIDSISTLPKIIVSHDRYNSVFQTEPTKIFDTLICRFSGLIEYNTDTLANFKFQKIIFKTTRCFGECPVFELEINGDKSAVFKAIKFNKRDGSFNENIPSDYFSTIVSLLKYINPSRLDSSYLVNWTDDQTAITEITFNGKTKKIEDYGEVGNYGLMRLYQIMFFLRSKFDNEE